ncbi:unnamed protein product [Rangifer tarandus platyrhynchus]|uniref:Uncharacterized protein n=1 Tax=Rangifer tarandus platyrhynchus TaxID=3082113 RepID=A0AC59ZBE8_RANTA
MRRLRVTGGPGAPPKPHAAAPCWLQAHPPSLRDPSPNPSACPEPSLRAAPGQTDPHRGPPAKHGQRPRAPITPRTKAALSTTPPAGTAREVPGQAPARLGPRTLGLGPPMGCGEQRGETTENVPPARPRPRAGSSPRAPRVNTGDVCGTPGDVCQPPAQG